jgi:hypothetical protein
MLPELQFTSEEFSIQPILKAQRNYSLIKWKRNQRVISLEIQVGITNQINKWANTNPRNTSGGIRCQLA